MKKKGIWILTNLLVIFLICIIAIPANAQINNSRAITCCDNMSTYVSEKYKDTKFLFCGQHNECSILQRKVYKVKKCRNCGASTETYVGIKAWHKVYGWPND